MEHSSLAHMYHKSRRACSSFSKSLFDVSNTAALQKEKMKLLSFYHRLTDCLVKWYSSWVSVLHRDHLRPSVFTLRQHPAAVPCDVYSFEISSDRVFILSWCLSAPLNLVYSCSAYRASLFRFLAPLSVFSSTDRICTCDVNRCRRK